MKKFGNILREIRIQNGLTQDLACKAAGISTSYFSQLERSLRSPPSRRLTLMLAKAVGAKENQKIDLLNAAAMQRGLMNIEMSLPIEAQELIIEIRKSANKIPVRFFKGLISRIREITN